VTSNAVRIGCDRCQAVVVSTWQVNTSLGPVLNYCRRAGWKVERRGRVVDAICLACQKGGPAEAGTPNGKGGRK
jgi:hypothetical protein